MNNRILLAIIVSLAAGFAAGAWTAMDSPPPNASGDSAGPVHVFDSAAPAEARIAALERAVAGERDARLVLEEQLQRLFAEFERFDSPEMAELLRNLAQSSQAREQSRLQQGQRRGREPGLQAPEDMRIGQLVAGGFTEGRARQVLGLEDEMRMAALQAEYEARRNGDAFNPWDWAQSYQDRMRESLGDADYEKYLTAQGGQASLTVREVIGSSPANQAGLRPGDQILSYDGRRVFGMNDLKSMAFSGDPGEDVIVDIERNGQRMQIVVPRGPLGITGGGRSMGFRMGGG